MTLYRSSPILLSALTCLLLSACAQQGAQQAARQTVLQTRLAAPVDFSGSWERNYQLGDQFEEELNFMYFDLSRSAQRSSQSDSSFGGVQAGSFNSMLALARMADEITRSPTLEITQSDASMRVRRPEEFALACNFRENNLTAQSNPYGIEQCGWDADRMIFHISLPGSLTILHRFTLSEDQQQLNITTTLSSRYAPSPFTLSRYYVRYHQRPDEFDCTLTLTRNKVCTQRTNN
ncbi:MAG: hypothetical protein RQ899_15710 [Pseudomonadales bacterium]|nr:hypothetical protein [Pseudomonadales bacterium]